MGLLSNHDFREFIRDALTSHFLPNSQHAMENQLYNTGYFPAFLAISVHFFHLGSWVPRSTNGVAHSLAKWNLSCNFVGSFDVTCCSSPLVDALVKDCCIL